MILINITQKNYGELLDEWLLNRKGDIKESSYVKYETIINNLIKPHLGEIPIKKITEKKFMIFLKTKKYKTYQIIQKNNFNNNKFHTKIWSKK